MPEDRELGRQLKIAARTGKYIVGRREVLDGIKGSKLLVWSASANVPQKILDDCKSLSVPAVRFAGNPVELGHACGIRFRVSVIAVKAAGDADLGSFTNSTDYVSMSQVAMPRTSEAEEEQLQQKEVAEKGQPAKKKKEKAESQSSSAKREAKKTTERRRKKAKKSEGTEKDQADEEEGEKTEAKKPKTTKTTTKKASTRKKKTSEEKEE